MGIGEPARKKLRRVAVSSPGELAALARGALTQHPLLDGCDARMVDDLLAHGALETFAPGAMLSREGDPADYWLLLIGSVRVFYRSPTGAEVTVKLFSAPAAWAEMEVLTRKPHMEDCVAVDRVVAVRVRAARFIELLDAVPRFTRNVLEDTAARFYIAAQSEKKLAFAPVEERIAHLLLSYLRMFGVPMAGGLGIRVKLAHSDIASGIGASEKSVMRALSAWQRQGILSKRSKSYVIHDVAKLEEMLQHPVPGIDFVAGQGVR
jgi:CRP/FNR family transcriptional regulator, cyclic AMP receptor protein